MGRQKKKDSDIAVDIEDKTSGKPQRTTLRWLQIRWVCLIRRSFISALMILETES